MENLLTRDDYEWVEQTCPICSRKPTRLIGKRGGSAHVAGRGVECEIWECTECILLFPNPMPIPKGGLSQHYEVNADEYFVAHDKDARLDGSIALVEKAEHLLGRSGRLLDVGVGRGETLLAAKMMDWECEGVEPSSSFADYAEERSGVKIWREPIENSKIPDDSFDVVILAAVLEHLYDPNLIIQRISKVLRPGGLLFVDVPNEKGLYFTVGNLYQKVRRRDWCVNLAPTFEAFHVVGFSPYALRKLLGKHGLSPFDFHVYAGRSVVEGGGGLMGSIERRASGLITSLSRFGEKGTYIETWARKSLQ